MYCSKKVLLLSVLFFSSSSFALLSRHTLQAARRAGAHSLPRAVNTVERVGTPRSGPRMIGASSSLSVGSVRSMHTYEAGKGESESNRFCEDPCACKRRAILKEPHNAALVEAIEHNDLLKAQEAVRAGADVKIRHAFGDTLLFKCHDVGVAQWLIEAGVQVDGIADAGLCHTVLTDNQNPAVIKLALKHGATSLIDHKNLFGRTALHKRVSWPALSDVDKTTDIVGLLLAHDADPNAKDNKGKTPLHFVGTPQVANLLLAWGARAEEPDNEGRIAMHYVIDRTIALSLVTGKHRNAIKDVMHSQSKSGSVPLHFARDASIVRQFMEWGASVDITNDAGETPLHSICASDHIYYKQNGDYNGMARSRLITHPRGIEKLRVVHALLEAKANIEARNVKDQTALMQLLEPYTDPVRVKNYFLPHPACDNKLVTMLILAHAQTHGMEEKLVGPMRELVMRAIALRDLIGK